jgi:light-regulated signal transduction histidine kinase (bacteriophytochrome)
MSANLVGNAPETPDTPHGQRLTQQAREIERLQGELASSKAALEKFNFGLLHDLRAPLRHIRAFAQIIEEDHGPQLDAPVLAHLKVIRDAAMTAMQLVDGLAD